MWINSACEKLYDIQLKNIIGKHVNLLETQGVFNPSVAKLVLKKKQQVSILHSNKNGKRILTTGSPLMRGNGEIKKIVSTSRDITELISLKNTLEDIQNQLEEYKVQKQETTGNIISKSKDMMDIIQLAKRLSEIDSSVLITGESGVGKGVVAKYIHDLGYRKDKPFIKVNCGAIPEALTESELFGYEHGAFTGSKKQGKKGMFELAHEGTIFLDEIGELSLNNQVKVLQVIQDKEILKVGGVKPIKVDVRIIAATNKDLKEMIKKKGFREDLYYRLNVVPIQIPPLRERSDDIIPLIQHFLIKYNNKFNVQKRIDPNTMNYLIRYPWHGNVRELENIIERLVITTSHSIIVPDNLPEFILDNEDEKCIFKIPYNEELKASLEDVEKQIIYNAVKRYKTTRKVAKILGVSQPTIVRKMSKYNISDAMMNQDDT